MMMRLGRRAGVLALAWACVASQAMAQPTTPSPAAPASEPAERGAVFDILEYAVEGNSVLPTVTIERVLMPYLGPGLGMAQVEAARQALEAAYQKAGYQTVFVDVPEQRVDGGVVRLAVLEGRVERLRVTGSRYFSQGHIRATVDELQEGRVPNFNRLQQQLAQVNRTEDRRVQPVLRPGRTPGTVEADLQVKDRLPLGFNAELHNRHAHDTKPLRLSATLRYDNLFQREHGLSVTAITAPQQPSQSKVLVVNYTIPAADGAAWVLYGVASDSVVEPLGATTVVGRGTTLGLRHVLPLAAADGIAHTLTLGVDFKDLRQRVDSAGDTIATPLRYLPWSVAYASTVDHGLGVQTQANAGFTFAARRILRRSLDCDGFPTDQFECSRRGASGSFGTLRVDLRHERPLLDTGWRLAGRLLGHWGDHPLVSGEQLSIGGAETVRGYLESEASGDQGLLGSVEVRSPNFGPALHAALTELVGTVFLDAARVRLIEPLPGQPARTPLLGSGVGLRARLGRAWSAGMEIAWPRKTTANTTDRDPRLHVRVAVQH